MAAQDFIFGRYPLAPDHRPVSDSLLGLPETLFALVAFSRLKEDVFVLLIGLVDVVLGVFLEVLPVVLLARVRIVRECCDVGRLFGEAVCLEYLD